MKKTSVDSFMRGSRPNQTYTRIRSNRGKGGEKHPNQVCQKSCFKEERRLAPETVQSSCEGSNPTLMPVTGRTVFFTDNWKGIQASQQVLDIIQGYKILFVEQPSQRFHPFTKANSAEEIDLILEEINSLLAKDAKEEVPMSQLCYSSNMFLVAKK